MAQYAYFASQQATTASWTAILTKANARAASGGLSESPYSRTLRLVCSFQKYQAREPPAPHSQNQAWLVIAGDRCTALSSASSEIFWGDSWAGGGGGRSASPEAMSHVFQVPARGRIGFVPVQEPVVVGTELVHFASKPSVLPRFTASAPIARPSARPAVISLGNATPATLRDRPASSDIARNFCALSGKRYANTSDAAPATAACSDG